MILFFMFICFLLYFFNRTNNHRFNQSIGQSATNSTYSSSDHVVQQSQRGDNTQILTMVRDKLCINPEESLSIVDTPGLYNNYRKQIKTSLRDSFNTLPIPKNDYEIVVPEDKKDVDESVRDKNIVEDQADIDDRAAIKQKLELQMLLKKRSQVIQRSLPRPLDINTKVLRQDNQNLNDLQSAEELIKHEMITMLLYDAIKNPVNHTNTFKLEPEILQSHRYVEVPQKEFAKAKQMLADEMKIVKGGMAHGDLTLDVFIQVWEECFSQVFYLSSQNRYTRAHLATKKDRLESCEKRLDQNRFHMANGAKRCGKIEKRLKILTNGYQSRVQTISKTLHDTYEQIEQNHTTYLTFEKLADQEKLSILKRLTVSEFSMRKISFRCLVCILKFLLDRLYKKMFAVKLNEKRTFKVDMENYRRYLGI